MWSQLVNLEAMGWERAFSSQENGNLGKANESSELIWLFQVYLAGWGWGDKTFIRTFPIISKLVVALPWGGRVGREGIEKYLKKF